MVNKNETKLMEIQNKLLDFDMDNIDCVKKLAGLLKKWAEWNKGGCTIEVLTSFRFNTIIVLHDSFGDSKFEDSHEFLEDVLYLLDLYIYSCNNEEDLEYLVDFWDKELNGLVR